MGIQYDANNGGTENGSGIGTSVSTTLTWFKGFAPPTDNTLAVFVGQSGLTGTPAGVTFPAGWVRAIAPVMSLDGTKSIELWYIPKGVVKTPSTLIQFDNAVRNLCRAVAFSGIVAAAPFNASGSAQPVGSNTGPKIVATSGADGASDAVIAVFCGSTALTQNINTNVANSTGSWIDVFTGAGHTANATQMGVSYKIGGAAAIDQWAATLSVADTGVMLIASFLADTSLISPPAPALSMAGIAPTVQYTASIAPPTGACAVAGNTPVVRASIPVLVGALALAGNVPLVIRSNVITPATGAAVFAGVAPVLTQPVPTAINTVPGSLALTGTASLTAITKAPVNGFMILAGLSPPLDINAKTATGALAVSGQPAVFNRSVPPNAGQLALTEIAPVEIFGTVLVPSTGALNVSGTSSASSFSITPNAGTLALTPIAAAVLADSRRTPVAGALAVASVAPVLVRDTRLSPFVGALAFITPAPIPVRGTVAAPNAGVLAALGIGAAVTAQFFARPPTAPLSLAGTAQNLGTGIRPAVVPLVFGTPPPAIAQSFVIITSTGQLAVAGFAVTPPRFDNGFIPPTGVLVVDGKAAQLSFVCVPPAGEMVLLAQERNLPITKIPGAARLDFTGRALFIGKDVRVFGLILTER